MFDEDKINALLKGSKENQKKQKPIAKPSVSNVRTEKLDDLVIEVDALSWGGASQEESKTHKSIKEPEKKISMKEVHKQSDLNRIKRQAEDRLRRIGDLQQELRAIQNMRREENLLHKQEMSALAQRVVTDKDGLDLQMKIDQQRLLIADLQKNLDRKEELDVIRMKQDKEIADLRKELDQTKSNPIEPTHSLSSIFDKHGLSGKEHVQALHWLIDSGFLPISHMQVQNDVLLSKVLKDKCHIQAENIPLPKDTGSLYINVPLARCALSGGHNIPDLARLFKDELLINGCTNVVIFGGQGSCENLLQVLFVHHALKITLAPTLAMIKEQERVELLSENQLALSWDDRSYSVKGIFAPKSTSLGAFLHHTVEYLRKTL
jgi:hypothetical protein